MSEADPRETAFLQELGQSVRQTRAVRGMSRKVLSQTSGLSERYIAQLESGQGNVSILLLRRVASAMGARLDDLIPGSEAPPDWAVVRDLLRNASDEQVTRVKTILAGDTAPLRSAPASRVALIGLRGAGKSTLGQLAADRLGWRFVELDREIERDAGLSMAEIFALYGKPTRRGPGRTNGVDVVVNFTGGDTWVKSLRCLRVGGRIRFRAMNSEKGVTPGSSCIVNAYTSNHDKIADPKTGKLKGFALHAVDATGLVHALLLRIQALLVPVKTLVLSGH